MKKLFTFIYTLCLCAIVTGCSSAGGISTFTVAVEKMPSNFDPQITNDSRAIMVLTNVFDGLFEKRDGQIVKNIAENCEISADGRTYTITIKQGNLYHYKGDKERRDVFEGMEVKAEDFVFAINRILDPKTHSPYYDDFFNVESAVATGDYSLVIKLKKADFNFTEKLCMPAAYPCSVKFFNTCGGAYGLSVENMLCNGPFKLNYLDTENGNATIVSTREDDGDKLSRIRLVQVDAGSQAEKYLADEISGFFTYSTQDVSYEDTQTMEYESANISLVFNMNKTMFANENIRKALGWYAYGFENSGANKNAVAVHTSIFPGTITLAGEYITKLYTPSVPAYISVNPKEMMNSGLAQLGKTKMDACSILMPSDSIYTLIFENINQLWQKNLGQFFTIEYLPVSQIKERIAKGEFDMAFLPVSPENDTVYGILDSFTTFDTDVANYTASAKANTNQANALADIKKAANIVNEKAMIIPMGSEKTVFYYRDYFHNIYIDPFTSIINLKYTTVK
ncbi:MAG: hypothetical protein IKY90_09420 [Oscillospiraceae bacterium]|nr:hypothetical protein [Oscillospiraceae bacterium]